MREVEELENEKLVCSSDWRAINFTCMENWNVHHDAHSWENLLVGRSFDICKRWAFLKASSWLWKIYLPSLAVETLHYWLRFDRKVNLPSLRGLNSMLLRFFPPSMLSLSLPISLSHWTWIENFQSFHLINRESFPSLFFHTAEEFTFLRSNSVVLQS